MFARVSSFLESSPVPNRNSAASVSDVGAGEIVVIQGSYGTCALEPDAPVEIEAVTGLQIPDSLLP
jgi:hypothetical protein